MNGPRPDAASAARTLEALRTRRPLIQCLTNTVSANFVANVLLAVGAAPAMVDNPEEAAGFAAAADAVLLNLGTPTGAQVEAMRLAAAAAHAAGTPVVLDPIGAGGLPWRGVVARELLAHRPAAIRGNASEIAGLARLAGWHEAAAGGRGVDSLETPEAVVGAARALLADGVRDGHIITTRPQDRPPGLPVVGRRMRKDARTYVAFRNGEPCRICATPVRMELMAGRKLYWCPTCQAS